jgi:catechol 2,3-dioxygenase-like lactoylglutathione lyase family enzyme
MASVSVRYIVDDVDAAIEFYCANLGFQEVMHPAPTFAMLQRDDLRLVLSAPGGGPGGGQAMPDGSMPRPGGWTVSRSWWPTSRPRSTRYARVGRVFEARSSTAWVDGRCWSRTRRATRWSFSSRPARRRGSTPPLRRSPNRPESPAGSRDPRRTPSTPGGERSCRGPRRRRRRPPARAQRSDPARRSTAHRTARGRPARAGAREPIPGGGCRVVHELPHGSSIDNPPAASAASSLRRASWMVL